MARDDCYVEFEHLSGNIKAPDVVGANEENGSPTLGTVLRKSIKSFLGPSAYTQKKIVEYIKGNEDIDAQDSDALFFSFLLQ